jgi:hypothetical protein
MKHFPLFLLMLVALSFDVSVAADSVKKGAGGPVAAEKPANRLRFVPQVHEGNQASSTELHPFPERDSEREAVQAWSGVGDSFPVREKGGKKLFEVAVVAGDDDRLEVEIRADGAPQKVTVVRDQRATFKVADREYEIVYLSVYGGSAEKTTAEQAMVIVSRVR